MNSFVDYYLRDMGGVKTNKFLHKMKELIPFKQIEEVLIDKGLYSNAKKNGRPYTRANILVGTLFLQNWYNLSDPQAEELINDRISFRHFLDIKVNDIIPDETTICRFRNKLIEHDLLEYIFNLVKDIMNDKRLILNNGTLVDASLIHSSEPKRKKDSSGNTISNKANDKDASYTSKRGVKHHGYKMHISTDTNGIIKDIKTTSAKVHDSTQFDKLVQDETKAIFADSGYMSKIRKKTLRAKGIFNGTIERRVRGQKTLRTKQSINNKRFAKIRCLVELPFAFIKHHMNYQQTRYLGIGKNNQHFHLLAACYNLRRIPNLVKSYGS